MIRDLGAPSKSPERDKAVASKGQAQEGRPAGESLETPAGLTSASIAQLQRFAGNAAVSSLLTRAAGPAGPRPTVQRDDVTLASGHTVGDSAGASANLRADVLVAMDRLHQIGSMDDAPYSTERAQVAALPEGALRPDQIPQTRAALARNRQAILSAAGSQRALHLPLSGGVGAGQSNDKTDVAAVQDLLHAEWFLTNESYDRERAVVNAAGAAVDPGAVPDTIAGIPRLKAGILQGTPLHAPIGAGLSGPRAAQEQADITAYDAAKAQHDTNRTTLRTFVDDGFNQRHDRMLKNSTEWVRTNRIKIFPLTPTHDSAARAVAAGKPAGAAYFSYPTGDLMSPAVYYTRRMMGETAYDNTNVNLEDTTSVDGFQDAGVIAIMQSAIARGRQYFWSVLRHELQHAADFHGAADIDGYKTEFRAYWLGSREYDAISPTRLVHHKGWTWNARQYAIFNNLYTSADYAYVKTAWDAEDALPRAGRNFQRAVVDFWRPVSVNPSNSLRVGDFYSKLTATSHADCDADTRATPNPNVAALRVSAMALDRNDRRDVWHNLEMARAIPVHIKSRVRREISRILSL